MQLSDTLRRFLDGIGRPEEYEFYLHKFQREGTSCFALVVPSFDAVEQTAEVLAFDLHFLHGLKLHPITLLQGPHCDRMLERLQSTGHPCHAIEMPAGADVSAALAARMDEFPEKSIRILMDRERNLERLLPELLNGFTCRIHFLRPEGGLRSAAGEKEMYYYINRMNVEELHPDDQALAGLAATLLPASPGAHVSITSSLRLLEEMFTVRGAGTLVRQGSTFLHLSQDDPMDLASIQGLIENSFSKPMTRPEVLKDVTEFIVETNYRGAALLEKVPAGHYLSKFAVGTQARGEGLGQEIWSELDHYPALFWRSRSNNPFNAWYTRQSEGSHRTDTWHVYWRGIEVDHIADVIQYAVTRPADF